MEINLSFACAALLALLLCAAHSFIGEKKIFAGWRKNNPGFSGFHQGIIWASWHILSALGLVCASLLTMLALGLIGDPAASTLRVVLSVSFVVSAALVISGTRWRHPAWFVFLLMAFLTQVA